MILACSCASYTNRFFGIRFRHAESRRIRASEHRGAGNVRGWPGGAASSHPSRGEAPRVDAHRHPPRRRLGQEHEASPGSRIGDRFIVGRGGRPPGRIQARQTLPIGLGLRPIHGGACTAQRVGTRRPRPRGGYIHANGRDVREHDGDPRPVGTEDHRRTDERWPCREACGWRPARAATRVAVLHGSSHPKPPLAGALVRRDLASPERRRDADGSPSEPMACRYGEEGRRASL